MTSVIGISAFCLHCRASTTLLAAFSLPRAARPMPHKYKHNLSYTSWLQDRTPHISARGAQPICIHIKVTPQKKGRERKRGEEGRRGGGRERAGICKQGFHLICKNRHCSGINLHLSSGKESGAHLTVNGLGMAVRCTGEHCVTSQRTGAIDQYSMSHIARTIRYQ